MKNKRLLAGAALLAAHACALADPSTWTFAWHGWYDKGGNQVADPGLGGTISGEDRDGDGAIGLTELVSFQLRHASFSTDVLGCVNGPIEDYCRMAHFRFAPTAPPGGTLDFRLDWIYDPDPFVEKRMTLVTGERYDLMERWSKDYNYVNYQWGAGSTLAITQVAPVPEPAAWMMLAAGLAAAGALRRRARPRG
jgi:hypothetical protein